jgi:hypothetical protein
LPIFHFFQDVSPVSFRAKAVRTDRELECPRIDAGLQAANVDLTVLPDGVSDDALAEAVRDADLLLMCYQRVSARTIEAAGKLKGIIKFGVGIDAIDIDAARRRKIPVVNIPEYAEETVAEGRLRAHDRAGEETGPDLPRARREGLGVADAALTRNRPCRAHARTGGDRPHRPLDGADG